jgi:hypothetical protein
LPPSPLARLIAPLLVLGLIEYMPDVHASAIELNERDQPVAVAADFKDGIRHDPVRRTHRLTQRLQIQRIARFDQPAPTREGLAAVRMRLPKLSQRTLRDDMHDERPLPLGFYLCIDFAWRLAFRQRAFLP